MRIHLITWLAVGMLIAGETDALRVALREPVPTKEPTKVPPLRAIILDLKVQEVLQTAGIGSQVRFRENKGQVRDQNWKPRWDVLFTTEVGGITIHLKADGLHYQLYREVEEENHGADDEKDPYTEPKGEYEDEPFELYRVDIEFIGGQARSIEAEGQHTGYENFYNTPEGVAPVLFVRSYGRVRLKEVWNGVDVVFYGENGQFKYDFEVKPGVDPSVIRLRVVGAQVALEGRELVLTTPFGQIREGEVKAWAAHRPIQAGWIVSGDMIGFAVSERSLSEPLRIDPPVRLWETLYGGTGHDEPALGHRGIAVNNDALYVCGYTPSTAQIVTVGAHQTTFNGGTSDGYIVKFAHNGARIWATYYGGSGKDSFDACALDNSGNLYAAGTTTSSSNIAFNGHDNSLGSSNIEDAMLIKFNSSGVRQWGTYYGGNSNEFGTSCAVDASNNVYLAGRTASTGAIATSGVHQTTLNPGGGGAAYDAFLVKFNPSGSRLWGTYYGGGETDWGEACAVDPSGNVYLAGWTASTNAIASSSAHQNTICKVTIYYGTVGIVKGDDAFLAKFNGSNGQRIWGTYYGECGSDYGSACVVDANGDVYLVGTTNSNNNSDRIATPGAHQTGRAGDYDAFIAKFNTNGTRLWATYYGGSGDEYSNGINTSCALDASGNLYITGATSSGNNIATSGAHQTWNAGDYDAYLVKFNSSGVRQWGTYYGWGSSESGEACAVHPTLPVIYMWGHVYTSVTVGCTSGYVTHQSAHAGGMEDALLVAFADGDPPQYQPCTPLAYVDNQTQTENSSPVPARTWNVYSTPDGIELQSQQATTLELCNLNGQIMYTWSLHAGERRRESLSLPSGMYIVREKDGIDLVRLILQP